jgi:hypothetical protein
MKQKFFKVSVFLVSMALAGSAMLSSCGDDELTDVAAVRPETPEGVNPTVDNTGLSKIPTITGVKADEPNKLMTIEGTNLLSLIKVTRTFTAEEDGKTIDGVDYKTGDEVVEDITSTIQKDKSTNEALLLALADGKITAYYDPFDISKIVEDGGFNIPVPVIKENGFATDWASKTMTIEGENLDKVVHILVGDADLVDKEKTEITPSKITLPLWDGEISLNYDMNNPKRVVKCAGYKFPVPTITSVAASSEDDTKMVITGTDFDVVTGITIAGEVVAIPEDVTKETMAVGISEGEIVITYPFNDGEGTVKNAGYIENLPPLPDNHLDIIKNLVVGANDKKVVNKEDGSITITPAGNYTGTIYLDIPESELYRATAIILALESSVSGGQIIYQYEDGTKEEKYNWDSNQANYGDTKLTLPADKKLTRIILNNQESGNVFTLKYVEVSRSALPEGQVEFVKKLQIGQGDAMTVNADGSVTLTPAGNYRGTIVLPFTPAEAVGITSVTLGLEASIGGGQILYQFADGTQEERYNWSGDASNYGDTKLDLPEGKLLKQIVINNQEASNVFTLKFVEVVRTSLPEGHIQIVDRVDVGPNDKLEVNADGSLSITPGGNYTGTIVLNISEDDAKDAKSIRLGIESSISGGQFIAVFTDGTKSGEFYNWSADVSNYNDSNFTVPEGKTVKQFILNNQEAGNVFTLKFVEVTK